VQSVLIDLVMRDKDVADMTKILQIGIACQDLLYIRKFANEVSKWHCNDLYQLQWKICLGKVFAVLLRLLVAAYFPYLLV
jgi:hypothetical protein